MLPRRGHSVAAAFAVIALAGYALFRFREAILTFYFLDDFWVMRDASRVHLDSILNLQELFWFGHAEFCLYRPLTTTVYSFLLQGLFGFDSSGHHAVQLLIFTANVLLVVAIVGRITESMAAAVGAGLLYLLAPGQAVNAFWLSAFTVSGTTVWVLLMLWCWLSLRGWSRVILCTGLQVCGLLASEHAIAAPVLCAIVALIRQEPWRRAMAVLPSAGLVGAYVITKLLYLPTTLVGAGVYRVTFDPLWIVQQLGQYVGSCFNLLTIMQVSATINTAIGAALLVTVPAASWAAFRGSHAARLVAGGVAMFAASLAPVLVLPSHFYDHYICTAALGIVIAVVGGAQLLTRQWRWAVVSLSLSLLVVDLSTGEKAWRDNNVFRLVVGGSGGSASWVAAVQRVNAEHHQPVEVLVPEAGPTRSIFLTGEAHTFLPEMPSRVGFYAPKQAPASPSKNSIVLKSGSRLRPGEALPYWEPRWDWLRRLARSRQEK